MLEGLPKVFFARLVHSLDAPVRRDRIQHGSRGKSSRLVSWVGRPRRESVVCSPAPTVQRRWASPRPGVEAVYPPKIRQGLYDESVVGIAPACIIMQGQRLFCDYKNRPPRPLAVLHAGTVQAVVDSGGLRLP